MRGHRSQTPIQSISRSTQQASGETALEANITAAQAIAETVRSTLGPRGRDKMLITDGTVIVTNDGSSILHRLDVTHPAASLLVSTAESQESGQGDGTSSTVLFAGDLLGEAEGLLEDGLHPRTVIQGYRIALDHALETVTDLGTAIDATDRELLSNLAATTMTGRWDADRIAFLADLSVETAMAARIGDRIDLDRVALQKVQGGAVTDSELIDGVAINLDQSSTDVASFEPRSTDWDGSTIALLDGELNVRTGGQVTNATVETAAQLDEIERHETQTIEHIVRQFEAAGVDIVFCQKQAADRITAQLGRRGILVVERTRQDEFDALEALTGATRVVKPADVDASVLGQTTTVDLSVSGGEEFITIRSDTGEAHTLVLRAGTAHVLDELKRIFDDSLTVIKTAVTEGEVVPGGGAAELWVAEAVRSRATGIDGPEQLAAESFADALEALPKTLARNAGVDPIDTLTTLRAAQTDRGPTVGFDADAGVVDVLDRGLVEPLALKRRLLSNATEAATLILRIDDVIAAVDRDSGQGEESTDTPTYHVDDDGYPWAIGH
ncbi:thermosome subunit alpha [Halodesulfurarchaeum formicicum]|uniref:Thermosome subunit alpha n=1 Tax=Halodesulfurarchaeum formicicum TaxID=1873524 RepID=A0A1D8S3B0_9EURY|nr:thermosome subunit beta [Halodesulfurarchaeum formicicum]AOW79833.1 thermosome subunit alpha [Halodesulfurarchaeum formicicum]APE95125.1 thermosome subunit alpha [Halodesulfurarchaeum formicicum]